MTDEKALVPIEQKQVLFYDDEITAVLVQLQDEQQVYIPLRPICEYLGLDWSAQTRRIRRDPVLSKWATFVAITATNPEEAQKGGNPNMLCLPLDYLNGFLFGVSATRVRPELQERVILYQERCYKVLSEAFQEGRLTSDPDFDDLLASDTPAAQAYKMAAAIMKMARQQLMLEAQLETHTTQLADHENRLELVEEQLGDTKRHITPEQAMQISQAVKAVAHELGKRTKRNEYGGVYGELYRRYNINSYKILPKSKFEDALNWLNEWLQSMISDSPF
ncbi:MAG: ORF6C domain-containing protein [Anaerolineales bacterium]|nr:ORF6C domain-containing protein [Anaerolineales bacterium]